MKKYHFYSLILVGITLFVTVCAYLMGGMAENPAIFFNSDQLALPYLYKNLVLNHGHLQNWFFSSDPFFFPDALLFFIVAFFIKKIAFALLLCHALLLIAYYCLLVSVGKLVAGESNKNLFRISALLSLMLAGTYFGDQELFKPVYANHFVDNIIIYLLGVFLVLKILNTKKIIYYFFLGSICLLTSFSDPLFFVIFFSVFLGLLMFSIRSSDRKTLFSRAVCIKAALIIFFSSLLGFLINTHDWLNLNILFDVQAEALHHSLTDLVKSFLLSSQRYVTFHQLFSIFFTHNPITCLIVLAFFLVGNKIFWNVFFQKKNINVNNNALLVLISLTFCIYISVLAGLFLDPGLLLGQQGLMLRHFQTMIILPVFLGMPILFSQSSRAGDFISKWSNQYFIPITSLIVVTTILLTPVYSLRKAVTYYPPLTECLDNYVNNGQLISPNGVTNYWDAHVNDVLSKSRLNLVAVTGDLAPFDWLSTREDYKNKKFNFFLLKDGVFSTAAVKTIPGKPNKILTCPNVSNYQIYIYNQAFTIKKHYFDLSNTANFDETLKFGQSYPIVANSPYMKIYAFGENESEPGLWTSGKNPRITLYITAKKLSDHPVGSINFDVSPFLYEGINAQHVEAHWGSHQNAVFAISNEQWISLLYTASDWKNAIEDGSLKKIQIHFYLPNAKMPSEINSSSLDYRLLALRFSKFSFTSKSYSSSEVLK